MYTDVTWVHFFKDCSWTVYEFKNKRMNFHQLRMGFVSCFDGRIGFVVVSPSSGWNFWGSNHDGSAWRVESDLLDLLGQHTCFIVCANQQVPEPSACRWPNTHTTDPVWSMYQFDESWKHKNTPQLTKFKCTWKLQLMNSEEKVACLWCWWWWNNDNNFPKRSKQNSSFAAVVFLLWLVEGKRGDIICEPSVIWK